MNKEFWINKINSGIKSYGQGRHNSLFLIHNSPKFSTNRKFGFTLIEMVVAISLFSVVVLVSISAMLSIADANKKANATRVVMDNINFAMENMGRNIRTGYDYSCGGAGDCVSGGTSISFTDQKSNTVTYSWTEDSNGLGSITVRKNSGSPVGITSPQVDIDGLTFYVSGTSPNDGLQPRVLITLRGTAQIGKNTTSFNLQSTVSQRKVDS